jgi:hypothetical protein
MNVHVDLEVLCIREIPGSYLGPEVDYTDSKYFVIFLSPGLVSQTVLRPIPISVFIFTLFILSYNAI